MAQAYAVPATPAHIGLLAPRLRAADRAEVLASHGYTAAQALAASLRNSDFARTLFVDDTPLAMFGARPETLWALTTDAVDRHARAFWQASKYVVWQLGRRYPRLTNCIDARHQQALGWARRVGFDVDEEPHRCGLLGLPFHRITLKG